MEWTHTMCQAVLLAVILVTSAVAAPVMQSLEHDAAQTKPELETKNKDTTAAELEDLLHKESAQPPTLPMAGQAPSEPNLIQSQADQALPSDTEDVPVPEVKTLSKRQQYAATIDRQIFTASGQFPVLPEQTKSNSLYREEQQQQQVDLSPRAMAEYLMVTSDFDGFDQALADLIRARVLTSQEVSQYKDSVSWQYEVLLQKVSDAQSQNIQDMSRLQPADYFNLPPQAAARPVYQRYPQRQENQFPRYPQHQENQYPRYPQRQDNQYPDLKQYLDLGQYADLDQYPDLNQYPDPSLSVYPQQDSQNELQTILAAKQQTLNGILDVVLNEYYNKPETDYEDGYATDYVQPQSPSYSQTSNDDLDQLMAYLQESLDEEQENVQQMEPEDEQQLDLLPAQEMDLSLAQAMNLSPAQEIDFMPNHIEGDDIVKELNSLPSLAAQETEDIEDTEEMSGDDDDKTSNETKAKLSEVESS